MSLFLLTEGNVKLYDKFLQNDKIITNGTHFDVGKTTIRAKSIKAKMLTKNHPSNVPKQWLTALFRWEFQMTDYQRKVLEIRHLWLQIKLERERQITTRFNLRKCYLNINIFNYFEMI